ncbi:MAG: Rrf2 family transcriptional regulator [Verrucomicrobiota bacterium]|jgi:Rrf2 family protein|nr:Rrf2 family transcriptional regulator [Verrucomicrobiota bacterium]
MLSSTSEYAIRASTYIAQKDDAGPVSAKDVAESVDVPVKYLQQILKTMVKSGILSSSRGVGGGFNLKRPAKKVLLGDIVTLFDDVARQMVCPFGDDDCGTFSSCAIHDRWVTIVNPYRKLLEETTLDDLAAHCPDPAQFKSASGKKNARQRKSSSSS